MPSALNALPTLTATALGASLATGIPAGQFKAPTVVAGFMVPLDSLNFYVEASDTANVLNVNSTATSTQTSGVFTNTVQKGVNIFVTFASINATATFGLNVQTQDQTSFQWVTVARASLDGIQTGTTGVTALQVYPAVTTQASLAIGTMAFVNAYVGHIWRFQASITATASGGGANLTFQSGYTKFL